MQACSMVAFTWASTHLNITIIEMKKMKHRQVKWFSQGQTASE